MKTIYSFGNSVLSHAQEKRKFETAKTSRTVLRHLKCFSGNEKLYFSDLTPGFLLDFCHYLLERGCCNNTRLLYFRNLQALHRKAVQAGIAADPADLYGIVITDADPTVKRCILGSVLKQVRDAVLPQKYVNLAFSRDLFILSFYLRGIPFVDLAHLRKTDIKDGVLHYRRQKTGKSLSVTLEPCALRIINRYKNHSDSSPYLLPIIKCPGSADDDRRQYESGLRLYNKHLKLLPQAIGLAADIRLTSYTPRHTWASLAHNDGVEVSFISEALSHSSEKTTRCYMTSFTVDALAAVNRRVLGIIDRHDYGKDKNRRKGRGKWSHNHSGYLIEPELDSFAK